MSAVRFHTASLSRPGGRACNEDAWGQRLSAAGGLWVVADGLGGHRGGARAARLAVDSLLVRFGAAPPVLPRALAQALEQTQALLLAAQREEGPAFSDMRTTVVVLASDGEQGLWAHVGDSRLYHFRAGVLLTQTRDHSVPQALVNAGLISLAEIRGHEDRNRLLRSLGSEGIARPTLAAAPVPLLTGDAFLLCTDGFWEPLTETDMTETLATAADPEDWLGALDKRLLARVGPTHDNYTALAVWVGPP